MTRFSSWCLGVALAVLGSLGAAARDCPNEQATSVPVVVTSSEQAEECGFGIRIFGIGGSIFGERCPRWETVTPAHAVCIGAPLDWHRCVPRGVLPVRFRNCECGGLVLPFIETGFPVSCECDAWKNAGTVLDAQTIACGPMRPPKVRPTPEGPLPLGEISGPLANE